MCVILSDKTVRTWNEGFGEKVNGVSKYLWRAVWIYAWEGDDRCSTHSTAMKRHFW